MLIQCVADIHCR